MKGKETTTDSIFIPILPSQDEDYQENLLRTLISHPEWTISTTEIQSYHFTFVLVLQAKISLHQQYKYLPDLSNDLVKSISVIQHISGEEHNRMIIMIQKDKPLTEDLEVAVRKLYYTDGLQNLSEIGKILGIHKTFVRYFVSDEYKREHMAAAKRSDLKNK